MSHGSIHPSNSSNDNLLDGLKSRFASRNSPIQIFGLPMSTDDQSCHWILHFWLSARSRLSTQLVFDPAAADHSHHEKNPSRCIPDDFGPAHTLNFVGAALSCDREIHGPFFVISALLDAWRKKGPTIFPVRRTLPIGSRTAAARVLIE